MMDNSRESHSFSSCYRHKDSRAFVQFILNTGILGIKFKSQISLQLNFVKLSKILLSRINISDPGYKRRRQRLKMLKNKCRKSVWQNIRSTLVYKFDVLEQVFTRSQIGAPVIVFHIWAASWQTNNVAVRPAKTQISLGIRPVWSESSLSAWRKLCSLSTH